MGATTRDLFGPPSAAAGDAPATPGSYGVPPRGPDGAPGARLPDATRLGAVHLQVADLGRSLDFYGRVLGLRAVERRPGLAELTADAPATSPLVVLHERPGARPMAPRGRLGLYHTAVLLPDRAALGRFARHLGALGVRFGAGDHLVSEALYLTDPDGLGVEVYADRPRDAWRRVGRELMLATDPVDRRGLVRAGGGEPWAGMPAGTAIGHVHLHVGDLAPAAAFYADALGFDRVTWRYPGALFLGAGGYHHHLGTNTWAGPGARPSAEEDARLLEWTIVLPDAAALGADALAHDPWGTALRVAVAPAGAAR